MSELTSAIARAAVVGIRGVGRAVGKVAPGLPRALVPRASQRRAVVDRLVGRAFTRASTIGPPPYGPHERPTPRLRPSAEPVASIVVSSWNGLAHTLRCVASIGDDDADTPYEVIVVDDASTEPGLHEVLRSIEGIRLLELPENVGYLRATNQGVELARGQYVVLLNNDVQVTPGWLDALLERVRSDPSIGVVGARLIYPTGRLQEAGAIIWRDGTGWNYGRSESPSDAEYRYLREVDYCSAACLLAHRPDGPLFDDRFAPAYFEDTDLCFAVRAAGRRVVYEPRAIVFHDEGTSHGTDISSGTKAYQARNRQVFVDKWESALREQPVADDRLVPVARDRRTKAHVLVVDEKIPTPDVDSGSVRMIALLRVLTDLGHPVHFVPADRAYDERYAAPLEAMGIEVLESWGATRRFLRTGGPHVALCILSRPLVASAYLRHVRRSCPKAVVAYDMVDFHALRDERMADRASSGPSPRLRQRTARVEARSMAAADAVIAITEEEQRAAVERVGSKPVFVLPNIHDVGGKPHQGPGERADLLFVGSFLHSPNVDAVDVIIDELAPRLANRLPGVVVHVVGAGAPDDLVARAPANVRFAGWLPTLDESYASARVVIVPLRAGAGMKGKVGDAMAHGVPVVSTSIGAEGFGVEHGRHLLIADDPDEFVEAIERLMRDDDLWTSMSAAAEELVNERFSPAAAKARVLKMLDALGIS